MTLTQEESKIIDNLKEYLLNVDHIFILLISIIVLINLFIFIFTNKNKENSITKEVNTQTFLDSIKKIYLKSHPIFLNLLCFLFVSTTLSNNFFERHFKLFTNYTKISVIVILLIAVLISFVSFRDFYIALESEKSTLINCKKNYKIVTSIFILTLCYIYQIIDINFVRYIYIRIFVQKSFIILIFIVLLLVFRFIEEYRLDSTKVHTKKEHMILTIVSNALFILTSSFTTILLYSATSQYIPFLPFLLVFLLLFTIKFYSNKNRKNKKEGNLL